MTRATRKASAVCTLSTILMACSSGAEQPGDGLAEEDLSTTTDLVVTSSPSDDSYVTTYNDAPRGDYPNVRVGPANLAQQTYLKFPVSGLPAGASAVKATLKLHASTSSKDAVEVRVSASDSWSEATLDDANAPGPKGAALATAKGTTAGSWCTFDVSAAVTANGPVSFVLSVPGGTIVDFASKEAGAATAPTLTVSFSKPAVHTLFGAAFGPHDDARHDQLVAEWGGLQADRAYDDFNGVSPFLKTYQAEDVRWGAASNYSFKYEPSSVLAGTHDADLRSFFNGIEDDHLVYWTYWHEPDDELYVKHTFAPPQYRAAWAHIRTLADEVKATRPRLQIKATLIIMAYSLSAKVAAERPLLGSNGMYPGDDVIEVFGIDVYNHAASSGGIADAATQLGPAIDFAQAHHKPWGIGELGSLVVKGNPQGRATYLTNAIRYWNTRQAPEFVEYFDIDNGLDFTFDNDPAAIAVWKKAVTSHGSAF